MESVEANSRELVYYIHTIRTNRICNNFFSKKNHAVYDIVEGYYRSGQATVDSMTHANCMRDD